MGTLQAKVSPAEVVDAPPRNINNRAGANRSRIARLPCR